MLCLPPPAASFADYVEGARDDAKREDAELLLEELGKALASPNGRRHLGTRSHAPQEGHHLPRMEMTSFLLRWIRSAANTPVDGEHISDMAALTACQVFAADYPEFHYAVLLRELVRDELGGAALPREEDEPTWERLACEAAARRGLISSCAREIPDQLAGWLSETERKGAPSRPSPEPWSVPTAGLPTFGRWSRSSRRWPAPPPGRQASAKPRARLG